MDTTAKEIAIWAKFRIDNLIESPYYNNATAVYEHLADSAGLSSSMVRLFHKGVNKNPSTETLDKIVAAIKAAQQLHTAQQ